jgi:hypothetical protein
MESYRINSGSSDHRRDIDGGNRHYSLTLYGVKKQNRPKPTGDCRRVSL